MDEPLDDGFAATQMLVWRVTGGCAVGPAIPPGGMPTRAQGRCPSLLPSLAFCLLLGSCSSAPRPPSVDESRRRPANTQALVDLQACRSDLQNQRLAQKEAQQRAAASQALVQILAALRGRSAAAASAIAAPASAPAAEHAGKPASAAASVMDMSDASDGGQAADKDRDHRTGPSSCGAYAPMESSGRDAMGNGIYMLHFEFGSTRVQLAPAMASALVEEARHAPLVLLRGRTDGSDDAWAEARTARERAEAVRDFLVARGVPAQHIRTTWQASGDHAADNGTAWGRGVNRRVEIEVYRVAPVAMNPAMALHR